MHELNSSMRQFAGRTAAVVAATAMGVAIAPSIASAAKDGVTTGPVQWTAEGNDQCEVTFTIVNTTNSNRYLIDFLVDDEDPKAIEGSTSPTGETYPIKFLDYNKPRTVGRIGVWSAADEPLFVSGVTGYVKDREAKTSSETISLRDLPDLPNPEADAHTITYQMVIGPDSRDKGFDTTKGEFPVFETEVTGCETPKPSEPSGSLGSLNPGSLDAGSAAAFGSLVSSTSASETS